MATKRLERVGIDPALLERLSRNKMATCQDFLSRVPVEIMELGNAGEPLLSATYATVSEAVAPTCLTVLELQRLRSTRPRFISTLLSSLDAVLHGGMPCGAITEVVGPSGCGKTQLCMQSAIVGALPHASGGLDGGVLYFDTEGAFRPDRLVQMAQARFRAETRQSDAMAELTSRIKIYTINSCRELLQRLQDLEEVIIEHNVKLIIVDSMASLVRKEYDGRASVRDRNDLLSAEAGLLKYLAEAFDIPVLVTNHITTRFASSDGMSASSTTAALGNTWSHSVNVRLVLEYAHGGDRRMRVAKSPLAPFCEVGCRVEVGGLVEVGDVRLGQGSDAIRVRTTLDDYENYARGDFALN